jgi:hypothetical protein
MIRFLFVVCLITAALIVWRVHHGGDIRSAIFEDSLAVAVATGPYIFIGFRNRNRPKPATPKRFPWREWRESQGVFVFLFVLFAVLRIGGANLIFLAIMFGVLNLLMMAFRLWDRTASRRRAESEGTR